MSSDIEIAQAAKMQAKLPLALQKDQIPSEA